MEELQQLLISLNNQRSKDDPYSIKVFVRDGEGKLLKRIEEMAVFSDKNFCDIYGLFVGLREAKKLGVEKVLILTDNTQLPKFISNGHSEDLTDFLGFYSDIKSLINKFEKVSIEVVC